MQETQKSLLIICRQAPWAGPGAREALDIALAGGAFGLPVSLLFLDDGVFQLVGMQQPEQLQQRDLGSNLQALSMYGIEDLYVSKRSLTQRHIDPQVLSPKARAVDDYTLSQLIDRFDQVITL